VAGTSPNGTDEDLAVVRLTSAGALDTAFDSDGKATVAVGSGDDEARGIALLADGGIVIAGESSNGSNDDVAVARLTAAGALDTTFSTDGKAAVAVGSGADVGHAVVVTSAWKVVVAGTAAGGDDDVVVVVVDGTAPPAAPTSLLGAAGTARVDLSWTAPSVTGGSAVTGYRIEYSTDSGSSWTVATASTGTTATTYAAVGLSSGTVHQFRVSAVTAVGTGAPSATATATPLATPGAPTGLTATAGPNQVTLAWTAPTVVGGSAISGYRIEYAADGGISWGDLVASTGSTSTGYSIAGLLNGFPYHFRISALNQQGTGPASTVAWATPDRLPAMPTAVTGTFGDSQAVITWSPPAANGGTAITGYLVVWSGSIALGQVSGSASLAPATTSYTAVGLTNGASYTFTVAGVNAGGTGTASGAVVVRPSAPTTTTTTPTTVAPTTTAAPATTTVPAATAVPVVTTTTVAPPTTAAPATTRPPATPTGTTVAPTTSSAIPATTTVAPPPTTTATPLSPALGMVPPRPVYIG